MANLSVEQVQQIRDRLNEFCKANPEFKDRKIGKEVGSSPTYINQFRNDCFPTKSTEPALAEKIDEFLNRHELNVSRGNTKKDLIFAMTTASRTIFRVADYAKSNGKIGVITGVPGIGKTKTCKEFTRRFPTSILLEVSPLVSKKSIIQDIATSLNITTVIHGNGRTSEVGSKPLFDEIVNKLSGTSRLLIIDEGENLTLSCLEVIRRIQDFTEVGVLLSGTSILLDRLRGSRKELQQLFSRVGISQEIKKLELDDVKAILQINYPEAVKFAQTFSSLSKHNGRYLQHLITLVKKTIQETNEPLNDDLIDDAASSLLM